MPNPYEQSHRKVWQQNPLQSTELLVQSTCSGSYLETGMGGESHRWRGALCIQASKKVVGFLFP